MTHLVGREVDVARRLVAEQHARRPPRAAAASGIAARLGGEQRARDGEQLPLALGATRRPARV